MSEPRQQHRPGDVYEYVALQPIYHGDALAYNAGDYVPAANVEAHEYTPEQVERRAKDTPKTAAKPKSATGDTA